MSRTYQWSSPDRVGNDPGLVAIMRRRVRWLTLRMRAPH